MIYILLDFAIVIGFLAICLRASIDPVIGTLLIASTVFIAHAFVMLIHGVTLRPSPDVVYSAVPELRNAHRIIGFVPITYLSITLARQTVFKISDINIYVVIPILCAVILIISYFLNFYFINNININLQDFGSMIIFFLCILLFYLASKRINMDKIANTYIYFLFLSGLCLVVCILELALSHVGAATNYEILLPEYRLITAYRASGIFYNPNWASNWAALFGAISILVFQRGHRSKSPIWGVILSVTIIVLTGSRGGFITLAVTSAMLLLMDPVSNLKKNIKMAATIIASFISPLLLIGILSALYPHGRFNERFYGLFYRWVYDSWRLLDYGTRLLYFKFFGGNMSADDVSPAAQSVIGRLQGEGSDNAFLLFSYPGGALGLLALIIIVLAGLVALVKVVLASYSGKDPRRLSGPVFTVFLAVILLALQMRAFSVFPIWIFAAACFGFIFAAAESVSYVVKSKEAHVT